MRKLIYLFIILLAFPAFAQSDYSNDYGAAFFYSHSFWPRSSIKAHWLLFPGVQGDIWYQTGDFEEWNAVPCPVHFACTRNGSSTITEHNTHIYSKDTSVEFVTDGAGNYVDISSYHTLRANTCYMWTFRTKGAVGTEDLLAYIVAPGGGTYYDFATDSWGGLAFDVLNNIGTDWTTHTYYVRNDATTRTNYRFYIQSVLWNADETSYIDLAELQELNSCDITGSMQNVLTNDDGSDPLWGHSPELLSRVGTGPASPTGFGMQLDAVDDHLFCPDADCAMDPILWAGGGKFSVGCRVVTDTVAAGSGFIVVKWSGVVNQRSWYLARVTTNLYFDISDDGINSDANSVNMFIVDALHSFVSTFDPSGGPGFCESNLYYDAYQVDTDATMTECTPFNSTSSLEVGAAGGASGWSGPLLECALWERKLSAVEANKYISPHFPATNHGDGFWVSSCAQAASHSTCSTQVCRQGTPNECQAEGTGVQASFDQATEIVVDNSWEGIVGDPSAGTWAEWTKTETPGNGSASVTAYLADSFHKNASARFTLTGTTSEAELESDCIPVAASTAYYNFIKAKKLYGTTKMYMYVDLYLAADCSGTAAAIGTVVNGVDVPDGIYTEYGGTFTTIAGINSLKIRIVSYQSASSFLVDTISLKLGTYRKPWNENPSGAGTTTYTSRDYRLHNPLSDFDETTQKYGYEDGFCVSMWVFTDWDGASAVQHYMIQSPGTVGSNNLWFIRKTTRFEFRVYTAAGVATYRRIDSTADNWTAGYFKYIEACHDNAGTTKARHYDTDDGTWYDWVETSGNAVQDGASTELHIGHATNISYLDGYQSEIHLSPYSDIWPQKGFNGGRPPVNHHPY